MKALGITAGEIDIRPSAELMLQHIEHPAAQGEPLHDITYENVQAGERASHLFRLANRHNALVRGHGRPVGAGARLHDVRRGRPHVALQRECIGAEDADPAPDPLAGRHPATSTRATGDVLTRIVEPHRSPPNSCPVPATNPSNRRKRSSARTNCRTSTSITSVGSAIARARWHISRTARGVTRRGTLAGDGAARRTSLVRLADDLPSGSRCSCAASSRAASSSAPQCRTVRRSAPADRSRHAATGGHRAIRRRPCWLDELHANVPAEYAVETAPHRADGRDHPTHARTCTVAA